MKRLGFLCLASVLACNSSGEGDTDSGNNAGSGGSEGSSTTGVAQTDSVSETANTDGASGTGTTSGASSSTTSTSGGSSESSGSSSSTSTGVSSSTGDPEPAQRCADTGGTWDETACGDYVCGVPNACRAVVPGCDCGPEANFVEGEGCVVDEACATFSCFEQIECVVGLQYCEVTFPADKGAMITYACIDMPEACVDMVECACLEAQLDTPPGMCSEPTEDGLVVQVF